METGGITRPPNTPSVAPAARAEPLAVATAVARTELAPAAVVRPAAESDAVRFEPTRGAEERARLDAALREVIDRNTEIDPRTREVVHQTLDPRTGEVIRQLPDEAVLKLRAFAREMQAAESRASESDAPERARVETIA